jgi:WD40 repeat protein
LLEAGSVLADDPRGGIREDNRVGTFTPTGSMAAFHGPATLLNNGKVLMTGGANAELYDPATGTFTATGAYAYAVSALVLTLLADGRVLITGCTDHDHYCEDTPADVGQLYDPATNTFSLTGAYGFLGGTATLLTNGKVLFAGGATEFSSWPYAKLYDPSTGTFTPTGDMTHARDIHTATLLPDGRVLITGGELVYSDGHSDPSAELYDPSTGTLRSIGNMTARRDTCIRQASRLRSVTRRSARSGSR